MKFSPYPYAPLKSYEIPQMLANAAFQYGIDLTLAIANDKKTTASNEPMLDMERRLRADLQQLRLGPLPAVTR